MTICTLMNLSGGAGQGVMLPTRQHDCHLHACTLRPGFLGRRRERTLPFYWEDLKRLQVLIIACLDSALLEGQSFFSVMQRGGILLCLR